MRGSKEEKINRKEVDELVGEVLIEQIKDFLKVFVCGIIRSEKAKRKS